MNEEEPIISTAELKEIIFTGEIIENYPEDSRGHNCLIFGFSKQYDRPIHLVCAPKKEYLAIITVYVPSSEKWSLNFKIRKGA